MKASIYNILCKTDDGKNLAFNSTTCALAEVENQFIETLENIENIDIDKCDPQIKDLIDEMKKGNFVIEDYIDEIQHLKFRNNMGKFSSNSLGLTIAPTLNCNFKCPYCYEVPKETLMSKKVQEGIISLVEKNAPNIGRLSITWYGGEPLIGSNIIFTLSEQIMKICSQNNIKYHAYIVTNGYLINDDILVGMKNSCIEGCQITVDGPPEIHNKRRVLRNGDGTFDVILNNIKKLISNDINVSLRVNIDKTNVECIEHLLLILREEGLNDLIINFGQVTAYTDACSDIACNCLQNDEYSSACISLQKKLHEYDFKAENYPYYPGIKGNYCCADQVNSFVIDADGYLYKCWNSIGNINEAVGKVDEIDTPNSRYISQQIDWVLTNPFEGKCLDCKLLPICMGGCPYLKKEEKEAVCEKWIYNFEEMLKYTYFHKNKSDS